MYVYPKLTQSRQKRQKRASCTSGTQKTSKALLHVLSLEWSCNNIQNAFKDHYKQHCTMQCGTGYVNITYCTRRAVSLLHLLYSKSSLQYFGTEISMQPHCMWTQDKTRGTWSCWWTWWSCTKTGATPTAEWVHGPSAQPSDTQKTASSSDRPDQPASHPHWTCHSWRKPVGRRQKTHHDFCNC